MNERALTPVVGIALLVAVTVVLAATVAMAFGSAAGTSDPAPTTTFDLTVTTTDRVILVHEGGNRLDVRDLDVRIAVDGEPLTEQPPVPFFATSGFVSGPTGPFNTASDPFWTAGERASLTIATTNHPTITADARIRVRILTDDHLLWESTTVASEPRIAPARAGAIDTWDRDAIHRGGSTWRDPCCRTERRDDRIVAGREFPWTDVRSWILAREIAVRQYQ